MIAFHCSHSQTSDPPVQDAVGSFFAAWSKFLDCTDEDMISQVHATGVDGRTQCARCTVVEGHHGGLRQNPQPVMESIEDDSAPERGWITQGRTHPFTVPVRLVPKNVVSQHKWRMHDNG